MPFIIVFPYLGYQDNIVINSIPIVVLVKFGPRGLGPKGISDLLLENIESLFHKDNWCQK